jgi:hypothetical protein
MERPKRMLGITLLAWVMLFFGVASLMVLDAKFFFALYRSLPNGVLFSLYWYGVIAVGLAIIAGIGILRFKERARKLALAVNLVDFLVGIPLLFYIPTIMRSFREMIASTLPGRSVPLLNPEGLSRSEFYFIAIGALTAIVLNLVFIYYFTRPNVKEQFK